VRDAYLDRFFLKLGDDIEKRRRAGTSLFKEADFIDLPGFAAKLHEILDKAVNGLAPPYRTVFVLRDVEGLSTEETAQALELSVPAVKSRLLRARLQLRDKLTAFFKKKVEDPFAYL